MTEPKLYHMVITLETERVKKNILVFTENPERTRRHFNEFLEGNLTSGLAKILKTVEETSNE